MTLGFHDSSEGPRNPVILGLRSHALVHFILLWCTFNSSCIIQRVGPWGW